MAQPLQVLIVGAGIGGLCAAIALAQAGIDVEVVEIEAASRAPGVGFGLRTNGIRALREVGLLEACAEIATIGEGLKYFDNQGNHLCDLDYEPGAPSPSNLNMARLEFVRIATARARELGCRFRMSTTVSTIEQHGSGAEVTFSDGSSGSYDLVVGYDGINSQIRTEYFGTEFAPVPAGGVAWRVALPRAQGLVSTMFCQGYGGKLVFAPLPDNRMYVVLTVAEKDRPRYDPAEMPQIMYDRARALLGDSPFMAESIELIRSAPDATYTPYSVVWVPYPWFRGRIMIMGDAAHAMTSYVGSGAAMSIEDGLVLAQELTANDSMVEAQIRFMARRLPRVRAV